MPSGTNCLNVFFFQINFKKNQDIHLPIVCKHVASFNVPDVSARAALAQSQAAQSSCVVSL